MWSRQSDSGNGDSGPVCHQRLWWRTVPNKLLIVDGLEQMRTEYDSVFNLFFLYGDVTSIMILKGKQALIKLKDAEAAKRCISRLNLLWLDKTIKLDIK
jgi:hypothetical protein